MLEIRVIIDSNSKIRRKAMGTLCYNNPTSRWNNNMSSKINTPILGRLLKSISIVIHTNHIGPMATNTHVWE